MKKKFILIPIIVLFLLIVILVFSNTLYLNKGEPLILEKNKNFELILEEIYIDKDKGPQLKLHVNSFNNSDYTFDINVWNYNGVYHKSINIDEILYSPYRRDLHYINTDENLQLLKNLGLNYSREEYKNAFDTVKEIGITIKIQKVIDFENRSILALDPLIKNVQTIHKKIIVNENKHKKNVFKEIYYTLIFNRSKFYEKSDLIMPPDTVQWLNFNEIISEADLQKINSAKDNRLNNWRSTDPNFIISDLKEKQYAICTEVPIVDTIRETYEFFDEKENLILKINSYIIDNYSKTSFPVEITKLYKFIYDGNEVFYWIYPVNKVGVM